MEKSLANRFLTIVNIYHRPCNACKALDSNSRDDAFENAELASNVWGSNFVQRTWYRT